MITKIIRRIKKARQKKIYNKRIKIIRMEINNKIIKKAQKDETKVAREVTGYKYKYNI